MERYFDVETEPPEPDDFEFQTSIDYIFERAPLVQYGILPRDGGWDDQTQAFTHDYFLWAALHNRVSWQNRPDLNDKGNPLKRKRTKSDEDTLHEWVDSEWGERPRLTLSTLFNE